MIEPNPGFLSQLRSYEDQLKSRFLADPRGTLRNPEEPRRTLREEPCGTQKNPEEPQNPTSLLV